MYGCSATVHKTEQDTQGHINNTQKVLCLRVSFNKINTLNDLFDTNHLLGGEHHVFQKFGQTRGRVVLAEPQVKLQLLQAETLLGVSGQTHFQEILAIWRERQKDEKLTATVMHQSVNYTMNWFAYECVFLTLRQLIADFQLISEELCVSQIVYVCGAIQTPSRCPGERCIYPQDLLRHQLNSHHIYDAFFNHPHSLFLWSQSQ